MSVQASRLFGIIQSQNIKNKRKCTKATRICKVTGGNFLFVYNISEKHLTSRGFSATAELFVSYISHAQCSSVLWPGRCASVIAFTNH